MPTSSIQAANKPVYFPENRRWGTRPPFFHVHHFLPARRARRAAGHYDRRARKFVFEPNMGNITVQRNPELAT